MIKGYMKNSNIHNNFLNVQKKNSIIKKQKILVLFNYIIKLFIVKLEATMRFERMNKVFAVPSLNPLG